MNHSPILLFAALLWGCTVTFHTAFADDRVIADFESQDFGTWKSSGTAFRHGPAHDVQLRELEIENAVGSGVASSEIEGDGPQGTLTSPTFKIERDYISYRIAGGNYERHTCLNLLVSGKIVRSATGWNSDRFVAQSWDVRPWAGQQAQIQLVDEASGGWGHINVDHTPSAQISSTGPNWSPRSGKNS